MIAGVAMAAASDATPLAIAVIGTFGTLIAGIAAFVNGWRSHRLETQIAKSRDEASAAKNTADLQQAEIVGWQTLIETTRHQYQNMVDEAAALQARLNDSQIQIKHLEDERDGMKDLIESLQKEDEKRGGSDVTAG